MPADPLDITDWAQRNAIESFARLAAAGFDEDSILAERRRLSPDQRKMVSNLVHRAVELLDEHP